jgi:hypothetical protein
MPEVADISLHDNPARHFGPSSLTLKLRDMRDEAYRSLSSGINLRQFEAAFVAFIVAVALSFVPFGGLYLSSNPTLSFLATVLMVTLGVSGAYSAGKRVGRHLWQIVRSDYQLAMTALHATDVAAVIADDDLRAEAYRRLQLAETPSWLTGNEGFERHVGRASKHFTALLKFADNGRFVWHWSKGGIGYLPPRTALLALCDFFTGEQTELLRGWRCALEEKVALVRTLPDVPADLAMSALPELDLGAAAPQDTLAARVAPSV